MKKAFVILVAALLVLGFGQTPHASAQGKVVRITLIDENGSGEDGSAQLTDQGDGTTKVELIMLNVPEGDVQPASVHKGTCATLGSDTAFALDSVKESKSTTIVKAPLADLTKEKHAIAVYRSASEKVVISCGNLPTGAAASGEAMTLDQALTKLVDDATELLNTIKKKEVDASLHAYEIYHATFASNEEAIKAKSADTQAKLEDDMHAVRDAVQAGKFPEAETAGEKLVADLKAAQTALAGRGGSGAAMSLNDAITKLQAEAGDLVRETTNKDKEGSQRAYDEFHETFAANEEAIKAKNAEAQEHIEEAMHEVRDGIQAGDFTKASAASNELVSEVNDAARELGVSSAPASNTGSAGNAGNAGNSNMLSVLQKLAADAGNIEHEANNGDKDGTQRAYDTFHDLFASNEAAIKAANPEAQEHLETAMHEVRDNLAAGDLKKVATASAELVTEANDAIRELGGAPDSDLPTSGSTQLPLLLLVLAGVGAAIILAGAGLKWSRQRAQ
ncbi:MAG TPA: hypothetical protein VGE45_16725 [Chloroflexia bacterium]|jgi:hypothetical protein